MGNIFDRREKLLKKDCNKDSHADMSKVNENIKQVNNKDILAFVIAAFKIVLPIIFLMGLIFFLVILFMVKVWFK